MTELTEAAQVRRVADRLGFGLGGEALAQAQTDGLAATVRRYLAVPADDAGATATPVPDLAWTPMPGKGADGNPDRAANQAWRKQQNTAVLDLGRWWLDRMAAADDQLTERLTWFWHGHFATSAQKVKPAFSMLQQNLAFRRLGRGDFRELAQALIVDPAMLIWLDGNDNTATAPNENLSREFMELFTLGHGNYAETDIKQAARALTGWKIDPTDGHAVLRPKLHDNKEKSVLGTTANLDADGFVDLLLKQDASAKFVASRLWFRLVSATPPDPDTLARLVEAYGPGRNITAVVEVITAQPAFADAATSLVKQPVEWLVGLLRVLRVRVSALPKPVQAKLLTILRGMGQVPFRPPSVGGWPAGAGWLTTASALSRMEAARLLATQADLSTLPKASAKQRPEQVRRLLGVDAFSARTVAAIGEVADKLPAAIAVGACSPEYTVSA